MSSATSSPRCAPPKTPVLFSEAIAGGVRSCLHLVKAFFEFHPDGILVVAFSDEYDLVFAVAIA